MHKNKTGKFPPMERHWIGIFLPSHRHHDPSRRSRQHLFGKSRRVLDYATKYGCKWLDVRTPMWNFYPYQGQAFHGFLSGGGLKDNKLEGFRPKLTRPVRLCEYDKICAESQIPLRARR